MTRDVMTRNVTPRLLVALFAAWLGLAADARAANVLLVIQNSNPSSSESSRISSFQSWGHTVSTIRQDRDSSEFNSAMSQADVVYIPCTIQEWELGTKVKSTTKGVVCEERYLDIEMGFSTADGWDASHTNTEVLNNSHSVTTGLSTGYVTIVSSSQPLAMMNPTVAGGMTVLSKQNYAAGNMLGVIETGGALAGGGTAAGRRVRMPWGGDSFNWSALNANGLRIAQQAIAWAAGNTGLLLHWKLDETSGPTATDSSGNGRHGTLTGTTAWTSAARRNGGLDLASGAKVQVNGLLGNPANFTVAAWVKIDSLGANGSEIISLGDCVALRATTTHADLFFYNGSNWIGASHAVSLAGAGWRHLVGVFDDAANTLKLYLDGVLVATTSTTSSVSYSGLGANTVVGAHGNGNSSYSLDGVVDDVRVYGSALSNAQIAEVYGLIAHWKLDESSGSTAVDSSLAGNNATRTGTAGWTGGADGGAHDFDYTDGDDYFTAPTNTGLNDVQEDDYTVMAYFKPNSLPPGTGSANDAYYGIVRKAGWHTGLLYSSEGYLFFEHWLQPGPTWSGAGDWTFHAPGSFYHVAAVVSRTQGTIKFYVDGVLKGESTFTPGSAAREYGSTPWRIGISSPGDSEWRHPADGVVDDVRIYNRAVTAEEIAQFATSGLIAHWKFDEGTGTTVADAQGNYPAAFDNGAPTWIDGVRRKALQFNGSTDADTNAPLDPPGVGTLALWFRFNSAPSGTQRLLGLSDDWEIRTDATGALWADLCVGGLQNVFKTSAGTAVGGVWRHLTAVYNSNTDLYKLYLDGELVAAGSLAMTDPSAALLSFGSRIGTTAYFNGAIDDVRLYNYELSEEEIAEVYGLIGHWKLDETSGTVAQDSSGLNNDADHWNGVTPGGEGPYPGLGSLAYEFDGVDDGVGAPTRGEYDNVRESVSISAWARFDTPIAEQTQAQVIVARDDWGSKTGFIMLADQPYNDAIVFRVLNGTTYADAVWQSPDLKAGEWVHLVGTFNGSEAKIFANGQLIQTTPFVATIAPQLNEHVTIGYQVHGGMRDVRLYNRAITEREIAELYGLVGWWRMEETSGSAVADSSGMGNDGTVIGTPAWSSDAKESFGALQLDGASYVEIPTTIVGNAADGVAISGWAKLTDEPGSGAELISLGNGFAIRLDSSGTETIALGWTGSTWESIGSLGTWKNAGWRHFVASFDATSLTMKLYVDGVERASGPMAGPVVPDYLNSVTRIGRHGGSSTSYNFTGSVDDLRVYNRPVSRLEARALFYGAHIPGLRIVKWQEVANP